MKTFHVGIVGFGFIGKVHAYAYVNLPFFYDPVPLRAVVTHVVTSRQETAERGRAAIGATTAATDYRAVTENPEVDIVHICTPNHLHKDALLSAMRHGKHIYCDKPLVARWDEVEQIESALADYRGTAQMTFHLRFFSAMLRARQLIDAGAVGDVLQFRAAFLHGGNANPQAPLKWKLSAAAGGGVIGDLASHVLDAVEYLAGPLAAVSAASHIAYPQRPSLDDPERTLPVDAEDSVVVLGRLPSGAVGTLEATKLASGAEDEFRLEIHGTRGALRFNSMEPHWLDYHDATASDRPLGGTRGFNRIGVGHRYEPPATGFPSPKASLGWLRAHVACVGNFLEAVAEGRPAQPDLRQGIRVQHLMECVRRSAESGQWVEV